MENRDLEVFILEHLQKQKPKFNVKPLSDFKYGKRPVKAPKIISKTLSNQVVEKYDKKEQGKKAIYKQIEIHEHIIQLTFTLSEKESSRDVEELKKLLTHRVGADWWIARAGVNVVIKEVTPTVDLSEYTPDQYTEKWTFDVIARTQEENNAEIEFVEEVELNLELKERRKKWE